MAEPAPNVQTTAGQQRLKELGVRPLPQPDALTHPYWDAARQHELRIQKCDKCGDYQHPPAFECQQCGTDQLTWTPVSGRGVIYSFIIDHRLMVPGFRERYVVAQVNPVEARHNTVRITANVHGCEVNDVYIGMPVEVYFEDINDELTLPQFRLVTSPGHA